MSEKEPDMAGEAKQRDEHMIAALKRERAVYVSRGDDDRVDQVDKQLKHYGYEGTQDAVPGAVAEPAGRTANAGRTTADGDSKAAKKDSSDSGKTSDSPAKGSDSSASSSGSARSSGSSGKASNSSSSEDKKSS